MFMKKIIVAFILLFPVSLFSQIKTSISGTIENGSADSVSLTIDINYISKKGINYKKELAPYPRHYPGCLAAEAVVRRNKGKGCGEVCGR